MSKFFGLLVFAFALLHATAAAPLKRLIIVAPDQFHAALTTFVAHKQALITAELRSLETILKSRAGADDPEKLKRFLFAEWKARGLDYVLLVGDVDVMPVRYMVLDRVTPAAFNYSFYPSDLYYSDLAKADGSFDDWNAQKEGFHAGYFGEVRGEKNKGEPINFDEVDYRPDVAVGRWPVSTAAEVALIVRKTIDYEKRVLAERAPGILPGEGSRDSASGSSSNNARTRQNASITMLSSICRNVIKLHAAAKA